MDALGIDRGHRVDPRGALLAELDKPGAGVLASASLPTSAQAFRTVADANAERQARQIVAARAQKEAERQRRRP